MEGYEICVSGIGISKNVVSNERGIHRDIRDLVKVNKGYLAKEELKK